MLWGDSTIQDLRFVQIGANDGLAVDPIHDLIVKHGWQGVCVEPLPEAYASLQKTYQQFPGVKTVQAAIHKDSGMKTMYSIDSNRLPHNTLPNASAYSSFFREHLMQYEDRVPNLESLIVEQQVRCVTFEQLLSENGIQSIDVIQIDAEGYDAEIVKMIDLAKYRPRFINFEHRNLKQVDFLEVLKLLHAHDYAFSMARSDLAAIKQRPEG